MFHELLLGELSCVFIKADCVGWSCSSRCTALYPAVKNRNSFSCYTLWGFISQIIKYLKSWGEKGIKVNGRILQLTDVRAAGCRWVA
mmetsp:Transcript_15297/g.25431  ORF Transcript_15297/g.25431 Transcript_15297/m.25431 type:complete len:87 (-) Transcript_15297:1491-1751(-)